MGRIHRVLALGFVCASVIFASQPVQAAEDKGQKDKALQLNDITGKDAISGKILELIRDKPALKEMLSSAAEMAKKPDQPFNYNGAFILAKAAFAIKEYDTSLQFYKLCADQAVKLRSGQKLVDVYDGLIALFIDQKKFDDAVKACQEFLNIPGDKTIDRVKPFVMEQMILALSKQAKHDEAIKLTDKLIEADEGGWYFMRLKAEVFREAGKLDEAIGAFEDAIERLGKSKLEEDLRDKYIERCRYVMSSVYTDLNQIDKAVDQLQQLLKKRPDSSTYHNDLGYIWADHDKNLDQAEKMIRTAIEIDQKERKKLRDQGVITDEDDKENAAYLDSLGWVLFKLKKYEEAKTHLLAAVKLDDGKHVEIYDHLAEVMLALGDKAQALDYWQKSLTLENVSKRDEARKDAVRKKIEKLQGKAP